MYTGDDEFMAITDTWLKSNSGKERKTRGEKTDRDGLSVRATAKGKLVFQMRYRYNGKAKRLDIGTYPFISLKEARQENQRLKAQLEKGHDPKNIRILEKQTNIEVETFEEFFRTWYEKFCKKNKKHHFEILRTYELYVFPKLGKLPADKITLHTWMDLLEELAEKLPSVAERILTNNKQAYKWGIKRQLVTSSPLADIGSSTDLQIRRNVGTRVLSDDEIKLVWQAIDGSNTFFKMKIFLKLCLFYGCRNGELRLAEKSHFDFDKMIWTVPIQNHKTGKFTKKPLIRPIIPEIIPMLEEAILLNNNRNKYAFGSNKLNGSITRITTNYPYRLMHWLKQNKGVEMEHWSMHDLRRTARTNFSTLTEPHIAEIMLAHKLPGSWQVYDHHDYLDEQAEAYRKWWDRLTKIVI